MRRIALLVAVSIAVAACGDDDATFREPAADELEVGHVHGLGVNPQGGDLFIATHHGLFRSADGERTASLVGDLRQDTMGFTVTGPDQFLASGHPDTRTNAPPQLGLIRSSDEGRTWQPVALEGEADFHTIEFAGGRFYAHDGLSNRLFAGRPGSSDLSPRPMPAGTLIDLAADPTRPQRLIAVTDRGMWESRDGARRWRSMRDGPLGLLAFDAQGLAVVDGSGAVHRQRGRAWATVGEIGGAPAALASNDDTLYAAVQEGPVVQSGDGGRSWTLRVEP